MNYGNCKVCGKNIAYRSVRICSECKEVEFKRIKEYLEENGKSNVNKIAYDLDLPKKLLFEYVIDGRLDASDIGKEDYDKAIEEDRKEVLANLFKNSNQPEERETKKVIIKENPKMRFLTRK